MKTKVKKRKIILFGLYLFAYIKFIELDDFFLIPNFAILFLLIYVYYTIKHYFFTKKENPIEEYNIRLITDIDDDTKREYYIISLLFLAVQLVLYKVFEYDYFKILWIILPVFPTLFLDFYRRKRMILKFGDTISLSNSLFDIELAKKEIKSVSKSDDYSIKIQIKTFEELIIKIPNTDLVKARDKEIRTELLDELMGKFESYIV